MTEQTPVTENISAVASVLVVTDIHRSVEFYRKKLGLIIREVWGSPPSFAIADAPGGAIMLKQGICEDEPNDAAPNHVRVHHLWDAYIWVKSLDPIIAFFEAAGTKYTPPAEQPHGCTEIEVTDPDNYRICFGYCP